MAALTYPVRAKDSFAISSNLGLLDNRGLKLNISGMPASLMTQAIAVLRRLGGTLIGLPDDYGLVLGPELVSNGGWAVGTSGGTSSASNSSGVLSLSGDGTNFGYADQSFSVVAGRQYKLTFSTAGFTINVLCGNTPAGTQVLPDTNYAANTTHTVVLTAASAALWLRFQRTATGTTSVSNISVREIISAQHFIDSTGTQPVTAVGDLVGLTLDRMGTVGPDVSPDTEFVNQSVWELTQPTSGSATVSGGQLRINSADGTMASCRSRDAVLTVGATYKVTMDVAAYTGTAVVNNSAMVTIPAGVGIKVFYIVADLSKIVIKRSGVCDITINSSSFQRITGNHATQATTASKPVIARIPRKLGPELVVNGDFSNGADRWSFAGAPNNWAISGGKLNGVGSGTFTYVDNTTSQPLEVGKSYVVTVDQVFAGSAVTVFIRGASVNIPTSTGTHRFTITAGVGTTATLRFGSSGFTGTLDNISVQEVLEWSNALDFDGSNDLLTLGSGAILQQGSDHFVTAAFVLDGTFAVQQSIYTCSSSASTTPLVCDLEVTATTGQIQAFWRDDSNTARTITGAALQIGVPYVATAALIGTTRYLWLNGVLVGTNVQGALGATTVNTANIGALVRTSTTNYFNGKLIDIAICQSTLTDADRRTIERAMAQKAGITL